MAMSGNNLDQKRGTKRKVALLGGTFDPVHNGHLRLALDVEQLGFDEVRLIPNAVPAHRSQPQACAEHRLNMLKLALADEPGLRLDPIELQHSDAISYSFDTLLHLKQAQADLAQPRVFTWVMGSDAFQGLHKWYCWEDFVNEVNLLVILRPGYPIPAKGPVYQWYQRTKVANFADLLSSKSGACYSADLRVLAISATEIRQLIAEGRSPRYLLPEGVLQYIRKHQLYYP
jgi:nicotinate-nucleotide adenylyltransferase